MTIFNLTVGGASSQEECRIRITDDEYSRHSLFYRHLYNRNFAKIKNASNLETLIYVGT